MRQTWRWFGPKDLCSIDDMLQAGVEGVVSALHHVPTGAVWEPAEIARRQEEIGRRGDGSASGLAWEVVESLPVSEDIKKQKGDWRAHLDAYRQSLRNLAAAGIEVVCYNFMPVLDWTRTDLAYRVAHGGTCMRFDLADFAAFDLHILERARRGRRLSRRRCGPRRRRASPRWTTRARRQLAANVAFGLPGAAEHLTLDDLRAHLDEYGAHHRRDAAVALRRLPRGGGAGGRGGRHPDVLPPRRPALRAARPAADHVDRGRLRGDHGRRRQPGQRHHALLGLARRPAGQRPARHDAPLRRPRALPAPAQRHPRDRPTSAARSTRPSISAAAPTWWR